MDVLKFVDTGSSDVVDFSNYDTYGYRLERGGWAPARATMNLSPLGFVTYTPVAESMRIRIKGATAAEARQRLELLSNMMERAEQMSSDDPTVAAIQIQYQPEDSDLAGAVKAVVLRLDDANGLIVPEDFDATKDGVTIRNIQLTFWRRGRWLNATSESRNSGAAVTNPAILEVSSAFTEDVDVLSPYDLKLDFSDQSNATFMKVLATEAADHLHLSEAESATIFQGGSQTSTPSISKASGGAVLQYAPTSLTSLKLDVDISAMANAIQQVVAFVVAKNLSSSVFYKCSMQFLASGNLIGAPTRKKIIDTEAFASPNIFAFGITGALETRPTLGLEKIRFTFEPSATGTASDALQLDYFCAMGVSHSARILDFPKPESGQAIQDMYIKHRRDTHLRPVAQILDTASGFWINNQESSSNLSLSTRGDKVAVLAFGIKEGGAADGWRLQTLVGNALSYSMTVDRTQAFLTPR